MIVIVGCEDDKICLGWVVCCRLVVLGVWCEGEVCVVEEEVEEC